MTHQTLKYEVTDGVALITLNRPKALNAINRMMIQELAQVLNQAEADQEVRVLILTGAEEKAFAAGADITEFQHLSPLEEVAQAIVDGLAKADHRSRQWLLSGSRVRAGPRLRHDLCI